MVRPKRLKFSPFLHWLCKQLDDDLSATGCWHDNLVDLVYKVYACINLLSAPSFIHFLEKPQSEVTRLWFETLVLQLVFSLRDRLHDGVLETAFLRLVVERKVRKIFADENFNRRWNVKIIDPDEFLILLGKLVDIFNKMSTNLHWGSQIPTSADEQPMAPKACNTPD